MDLTSESIPDWITHGRTVLLSKTEDLSKERDYRQIKCLNTCYNTSHELSEAMRHDNIRLLIYIYIKKGVFIYPGLAFTAV